MSGGRAVLLWSLEAGGKPVIQKCPRTNDGGSRGTAQELEAVVDAVIDAANMCHEISPVRDFDQTGTNDG